MSQSITMAEAFERLFIDLASADIRIALDILQKNHLVEPRDMWVVDHTITCWVFLDGSSIPWG